MPEYRARILLSGCSPCDIRLYAMNDEEAVRRAKALAGEAMLIEVLAEERVVATSEAVNPARTGDDAESATTPESQDAGAVVATRRIDGGAPSWPASRTVRNRTILAGLIATFLCCVTLAAIGWALTQPAGRDIAGPAAVVNGGALVIDGQPVWLSGVDAPRLATVSGREAYRMMVEMTDGREVTCIETERDADERMLATCSVGGRDLAEALIDAGLVRRIE